MIERLNIVPQGLAVWLLAASCMGASFEQAPSSPKSNPTFEAITGPGYLHSVNTNVCVANNDCTNYEGAWITNVSSVRSGNRLTLTFTIAGGSNGVPYDVFVTSALAGPLSDANWTWMGQGYQDVTYSFSTFTGEPVFLLLGTPQDSDGDGLTDAYELLVSHSNPYQSNSIDPAALDGWSVLWGLNPFAIYDQQSFPGAPQARLDYWRFNTGTYQSEAGLSPVNSTNVSLSTDWSGEALNTSNYRNWLSYPLAGPDGPGFNPNSGTMRFWYMPFHSSGSANGSGFYGVFLDFGANANDWTFNMNNYEGQMEMSAYSAYTCQFFEPQFTSLQLKANLWYQITLAYSPTNVAIYTNGNLMVTSYLSPVSDSHPVFTLGNGVVYTASAASQMAGFAIGDYNYNSALSPANGLIDELETFNYPLTPEAVAAGFPGFAGASNNIMTDSDYDGRSDMLEQLVDGTNPNDPNSVVPCRLGFWRFDSPSLMAEQGQIPLSYNDVSLTPSWSGTALNINSDPASQVTYWDVFTNGWANINCRQGSLRLWFKPNWTGHPPASAPLLYLGNTDSALSEWSVNITANGALTLVTASNGVASTPLTSAPLPFDAGHWMQLVLDYGPGGTTLYTNGVLAATGAPVTRWPALADRNLGLVIGNNTAYNNSINGQFDEIETFNYQLSAANIATNFQTVQAVDSDLDGVPDLLEDLSLTTARPFLPTPVVIVGTVEAEQFDMGGRGVGYYNLSANPASSYRPTGMFITNCNDLGLGYCLDQTRAGEWAQYTLNVLAGQNYTVEARVAGIGTNGVFECEFTGPGFYTNTGPMTIPTTNWTNVAAVVHLPTGICAMKLRFLTNGSDNAHVGRFNYISIYSWWKVGFQSTYTNPISAAQLSTNNDFIDASNNAVVIQQAINTLPATGGTVQLPAGNYYVAQASPNETLDANFNAAIAVVNNNVELAGAGKTSTALIGYNRATTVICYEENASNIVVACTNFTLRDMTIEAQPHLAVHNVTGTQFELGQIIPRPNTGYLTEFKGLSPPSPGQNIVISNCQFLYGDVCIGIVYGISNCLVTHCDFNIWGGSNIYTGTESSPPAPNTTTWNGSVGIFCGQSPDYNINILENNYNGNTNLVPSGNNPFGYVSTSSTQFLGPDGFVYLQSGGNYFMARNSIANYALEGVQFGGGPNSLVGNQYNTLISGSSTCALVLNRSLGQAVIGTNTINYCTCFIGNSVYGGRYGVLPNGTLLMDSINESGNDLTLFPPFPTDYPGAVLADQATIWANLSGNTLETGGHGFVFASGCGNALIMNNNFANVTYRGIGIAQFGQNGASIQGVSVINNILGQGPTFHVELPLNNNGSWFLYKNQCVNPSGYPVPPFLDPSGSAAHITE